MTRAIAALSLLALLSACGPMALDQAERLCVQDAQLAQHPRGAVGFGIGSGGQAAVGLELNLSSDYLMRRDPDQVYAACVQQRAGQPPERPFSVMPESRM